MVRPVQADDIAAMARIYNHYILNTAITLEEETFIYTTPGGGGRGIGSALYGELLPRLSAKGVHVAVAGIALPNPGSVALHEKFGFTKVAHFPEVGWKHDRWIDVGCRQRTRA